LHGDEGHLEAARAGEIERGITAFARGSNDGLIVTGSALAFVNRDLIVTMKRVEIAQCSGLLAP
jgi:hypothetical protein